MTDEQLTAVLTQRGYQQIASPYKDMWRGWLWVQPVGLAEPIPTKLCFGTYGISEEGLHWLLDHYCELKDSGYTDEQRAKNINRMAKKEEL